jgi:exopolysaccharide production protein ExoZ
MDRNSYVGSALQNSQAPGPAAASIAKDGLNKGSIYNLQALRGIAAMLVAATHLKVPLIGLNDSENGVLMHGAAGVDIFFVLSGFIMAHTALDKKITPLSFIINRIARIVPLYWLLTLFIFTLGLLRPSLFPHLPIDGPHLISSLLFIPKPDGQIVYVGWTLNYEMMFYYIFAIGLLLSGKWARSLFTISFLALFAASLSLVKINFVLDYLRNPVILEFALGILIALTWRILPAPRSTGILGLLTVLGFCALFVGPNVLNSGHALDRPLHWGLPSALVVMGAVLLERRGVRATNKLVQLIGDASYSIYLTHFFVTRAYEKAPKFIDLEQHQMAAYAYSMVAMSVVVVIGIMTYRWIEMPLTKGAKQLAARITRR